LGVFRKPIDNNCSAALYGGSRTSVRREQSS